LHLARLSLEQEYNAEAAFELHQAAEHFYHCFLLTITFYSPKSDRIKISDRKPRISTAGWSRPGHGIAGLPAPLRAAVACLCRGTVFCDLRDHGRGTQLVDRTRENSAESGRGHLPGAVGSRQAQLMPAGNFQPL
jgi:hypothetical protein